MKKMAAVVLFLGVVAAAAGAARAFHHHGEFQSEADGRAMIPGSGFLYYTGSRRDLGLRCSTCHIEAPNLIRATVDFSPALGAGDRYVPGATYRVTVTMTGETLGLSGCEPMMPNRNSISAMFTGRSGFPVGIVAPDVGGRRCGSRLVEATAAQTTVVFGDCDAVTGAQGLPGSLSRWVFTWQAPPAGGGTVDLWLGVTDGDCMFDSYNDDVYETRLVLTEG